MSLTGRLWKACAVVWLGCLACLPAPAQLLTGPGFDPTPVKILALAASITPRPITMMDLLTLKDVSGVSISPDAKTVAFVLQEAVYETNSYRTGLFLVSTVDDGIVKSLGSAGMPHWGEINELSPENPQWSPDGRYITYRARWNAASTWQVWRWSVEGGVPIQLTHVPGDVKSYEWTTDGAKIFLDVKPDVDPSLARQLSEHGILYDGSIYAWQGLPIVPEVLASQTSDTLMWTYDSDSGQEARATKDEIDRYRPASDGQGGDKTEGQILDQKVSPDGRLVVCRYFVGEIGKAKSNSVRLYVRSRGSNNRIELTPTAYYVDQYWWSSDSSRIFYAEYEGDGHSDELMVVSPEGGTPRRLYAGHDYVSGFSTDRTGAYVACTRESNTTPAQIALLSLLDGTLRTLMNVNPEFSTIRLSVPTRIEGVNRYGDKWFAHVVKPLNYLPGHRYPLIVTTYRSGDWFLRGASGNENPIQVYAANGFVVLNMDVGKTPNLQTGDFRTALRMWASPTASIEQAIRRLCASGLADPKNVGIAGYSHGAEIMAYAISHRDLFGAAIGDAGSRDPYFYYMAGKTWQDIFRTWGLGGWPEGVSRRRWRVLSPALNADHIKAPLLMNAADSEFVTDLAMFTSLHELRKPVELFVYANELHVKNQPMHRYEIYERNLDWFKFWLKGEESPAAFKSQQYRRWRNLRDMEQSTKASFKPNLY